MSQTGLLDTVLQSRKTPYTLFIPNMTTKAWLLDICLMVLIVIETLSQNCSHLRKHLLEDNKENLAVLKSQLGSVFPLQCLNDVISFSSQPEEENIQNIFELQKENATVALHEILRQILCLYSQNHTKLPWDENSIGMLKAGLSQEIAELSPCLTEDKQDIREAVKTYFDRIQSFLKDGEYNGCAWEVAQIEVSRFFMVMEQLIRTLHTKGWEPLL
ncbi:interferon beta-like [Anolis sagrei]|uniref:interferon beta-like n=1 Tax=Anolis sagrei TaxID=38937 RepID=UPI003522B9A2